MLEHLESRQLFSDSIAYGDGTVFVKTDAEHGSEIWFSNANGEHFGADVNPGPAGSNPRALQVVGDYVMFVADGQDGRAALYKGFVNGDQVVAFPEFTADALATGSVVGIANGRRILHGSVGSMLWSTDGTADSLILLGRSIDAPRTIDYHNLTWMISLYGGRISTTDGMTLRYGGALETFYGSTGRQQGYYANYPTIVNGWLTVTTTAYMRDAQMHPYTIQHTWYTDAERGWQKGVVPSSPPTPYVPPAPPAPVQRPAFYRSESRTLIIDGNDASNSVRITRSPSLNQRLMVLLDDETFRFNVADVDHIIVYGVGGNDSISISEKYGQIFADARIYGGEGNDTIVGASGSDTLLGENGNDRLYGMSGNDRLDGGLGTDRLFGGLGRDMFDKPKNVELFDRDRLDRILA